MDETTALLQRTTRDGAPLQVGETIIVPRSQAFVAGWPGGGGLWVRPIGVRVERDGKSEWVPIQDVTRRMQIVMLALAAIFTLIGLTARPGSLRR